MSNFRLKEKVLELRRLVTVMTKWPYWEYRIIGYTKEGNRFEVTNSHGRKPKKTKK